MTQPTPLYILESKMKKLSRPAAIIASLTLVILFAGSLPTAGTWAFQSPPPNSMFGGLPDSARGFFEGVGQLFNRWFFGGPAPQEGGSEPYHPPAPTSSPTLPAGITPTPTPAYSGEGDLIKMQAKVVNFSCIADNPPDELYDATCGDEVDDLQQDCGNFFISDQNRQSPLAEQDQSNEPAGPISSLLGVSQVRAQAQPTLPPLPTVPVPPPFTTNACLANPNEFNTDYDPLTITENDCSPYLEPAPLDYNPFDRWDACFVDNPNQICAYKVRSQNIVEQDDTCNEYTPSEHGERLNRDEELNRDYPAGAVCTTNDTGGPYYVRKLNSGECSGMCSTCGDQKSDAGRCVDGTFDACRKAIEVETYEYRFRTSARPDGAPQAGEACSPQDRCDPTNLNCYLGDDNPELGLACGAEPTPCPLTPTPLPHDPPEIESAACLQRTYRGKEISCSNGCNCGGEPEHCPKKPAQCGDTANCCDCDLTDPDNPICHAVWTNPPGPICGGGPCCKMCVTIPPDSCYDVSTNLEQFFSDNPYTGCSNNPYSNVCGSDGSCTDGNSCASVNDCCGTQNLLGADTRTTASAEDCSYYEWTVRRSAYKVIYRSNQINLKLQIKNLTDHDIPLNDPSNNYKCPDGDISCETDPNSPAWFTAARSGDDHDFLLEFEIPDFLDILSIYPTWDNCEFTSIDGDGNPTTLDPEDAKDKSYRLVFPETMTGENWRGLINPSFACTGGKGGLIALQKPEIGELEGIWGGGISAEYADNLQAYCYNHYGYQVPGGVPQNGSPNCNVYQIYQQEGLESATPAYKGCQAETYLGDPSVVAPNVQFLSYYDENCNLVPTNIIKPYACHGGRVRLVMDYIPKGCELTLWISFVPSDIDPTGRSWYRNHYIPKEWLDHYIHNLISDDRLVNLEYKAMWPVGGARAFYWDSTADFSIEPVSSVTELQAFWIGKGIHATNALDPQPGCGSSCFADPDAMPFGWPSFGRIDQDWGGMSDANTDPTDPRTFTNPFAAIFGPNTQGGGEYLSGCGDPDGEGGWRHVGITLVPREGEISPPKVHATHAGYVTRVVKDPSLDAQYPARGAYVEIQSTVDYDCASNFVTRYLGLDPDSIRVEEGEYVPRHKILGLMGDSGYIPTQGFGAPGLTRHYNSGFLHTTYVIRYSGDNLANPGTDGCDGNPYISEEGMPFFFCENRRRGDTVERCYYANYANP